MSNVLGGRCICHIGRPSSTAEVRLENSSLGSGSMGAVFLFCSMENVILRDNKKCIERQKTTGDFYIIVIECESCMEIKEIIESFRS